MTVTDPGVVPMPMVSLSHATVTQVAARPPRPPAERPIAVGHVQVFVTPAPDPTDEALVRGYINRLWAEDWDSAEDSVYDTW